MEVTAVLALDGVIVVLGNSDMFVLFHLRNRLCCEDEINLFALSLGMSKHLTTVLL